MSVLLCVGLSHRQAPIAVRELVAVPGEEIAARLRRLRALPGVQEALLLSTCNRLEIIAVAESAAVGEDLLRELGPPAAPHAIVRADLAALRHVFRVAASLDSMVVGEAQILGQVKEALAQAQAAGAIGPRLSQLLPRALAAAKRVRTETQLARGAVSLSSVAVQLARKVLGDVTGRSVLLLGAGEMAQLAARELRAAGAAELLVANRSAVRAEELAREVDGVPVSLAELPSLLERVDVALCSTGAALPLITHELMARALKARRYRPVFLIDLALPRNVEPRVNRLENVYVYDLDDLEKVAAQNREVREGELERAEAIVEAELAALVRAEQERAAVPVLARLRAHAQAIALAEAERTLAALALEEKEAKTVRAMAAAIVNKLLHGPTARLRAEGGGPLAQAAAELFALEPSAAPASVQPVQPVQTVEPGQDVQTGQDARTGQDVRTAQNAPAAAPALVPGRAT